MAKKSVLVGTLALLLAFSAVLVGCSGKKGESGGSSGGGSASAPKASGKAAPASDFSYGLSEDSKGVVIRSYTGGGGKVVIPAEIEGLPVVRLGNGSFKRGGSGADNLTAVVIPASVKEIGEEAFTECEKLTSVTFLGSGVELDRGAFGSCGELAELVFPDGENVLKQKGGQYSNWGEDAFHRCSKLPLAIRAKLTAMGFKYL